MFANVVGMLLNLPERLTAIMPTIGINAVTCAAWRKSNGLYPVRIRITFKRQSRTISTSILADRTQLTRSAKLKDPALIDNTQKLIAGIRQTIARLSVFDLEEMTIDKLVDFIKKEREEFSLDFPSFAARIIAAKGPGAKNYRTAVNALSAYVGSSSYDISIITSSFLERWAAHLEDQHGKGARAVSLYTSSIAYLHARARKEYNDEELRIIRIANPFAVFRCPKQTQARHRAIPPAIIVMMMRDRSTLSGRALLGVDVFLLSFALMGMNAPDLFRCRKDNNGVIAYNRQKTEGRRADRAEMRLKIEKEWAWIIDEYRGQGGALFSFSQRYTTFSSFSRAVNIGLAAYRRMLGLSCPLTLYTARHTWATIAASSLVGIDKSTINECLCHVDNEMKVTDIYITRDWTRLWEANRKVQALFPWEDNAPGGLQR